jgi:hypothetical protein
MKKRLVFVVLLFASFTIAPASGKPDLVLTIEPEPAYEQMWAFETYMVNINMTGLNLTEFSDYDLSGHIIADGIIKWKGVGQYHFGESGSGYSIQLTNETLTLDASVDAPVFSFNLTLSRDTYLFGLWPFETVEILMSFDVFLEEENGTGAEYGPRLGSISSRYILLDDDKVDYIEGKYLELGAEVHAATDSQGLPEFNRTRYESMVSDMNSSIMAGNYIDALDQWEHWDEKERLRMLNAFSKQVDAQAEDLVAFEDIETELEGVESELQRSQIEYDLIEDKYFALLSDNAKTKVELESAKQGLTTAITGIFLAAIVFFFLGRRVNKTEVE